MLQRRFWKLEVDEKDRREMLLFLNKLFHVLQDQFKDFTVFQNLILKSGTSYSSFDTITNQQPEELTKQHLIEPVLKKLGFGWKTETVVQTALGIRVPDYSVLLENKPIIYIEAEPLNSNLFASPTPSKRVGLAQVREWLYSKFAKTEYGLATNGFEWIIVRLEDETASLRDIETIDLRPIFTHFLTDNVENATGKFDTIIDKLISINKENLTGFLGHDLVRIEEKKESISVDFYHKYMRYILGRGPDGEELQGQPSLLKSIEVSSDVLQPNYELFAALTMNRLIFIMFLQDRGLVDDNLMLDQFQIYKDERTIENFYNSFLNPLFYKVFSVKPENRETQIQRNELFKNIPYLNGGLFNHVIEDEGSYTVLDEGIELILHNLMEGFSIGLTNEANLKPEILGYIFEKTINYVSGEGNNRQKMMGAYYTPEDVVKFIVKETVGRKIFEMAIDTLLEIGLEKHLFLGIDSIEDILHNLPLNNKQIGAILYKINNIRIIDPSVGSGHFLTVALNELAKIQSSFRLALKEDFNLYDLKRTIVEKNIFGVDLDDIAVEITKLRLWLSIISEADVDDSEHVHTLPNIDFNVITGNSLIGHLKETLISQVETIEFDELTLKHIDLLVDIFGEDAKEIRAKLMERTPESCIDAFNILTRLYKGVSGKKADVAKRVMNEIKREVYKVMNSYFTTYLFANDRGVAGKGNKLNIEDSNPIHWSVDFKQAMQNGGFDVVIGNPPYVEDRDINKKRPDLLFIKSVKRKLKEETPLLYESQTSGNTHAYFIERSIKLLRPDGCLGFIVPVSLVSTERMGSIRKFIHSNSKKVKYYNFDDRPGKIFSGIEHCRSTILISYKGSGIKEVITSKYHRWYSEDRNRLFDDLSTTSYKLREFNEIIPKIGTEIEKKILDKLITIANNRKIEDYASGDGKIWYHNAPQYWIHSHLEGYVPKVEYFEDFSRGTDGGIVLGSMSSEKITEHYKSLTVKNHIEKFILLLLNSSLYYWWFVVISDGRDLLNDQVTSFPFDENILDESSKEKITTLALRLMEEYENQSNTKINVRKNKYAIKIKEIIPKRSYETIKEIDNEILNAYELDETEKEFIKNFDIELRLGKNS